MNPVAICNMAIGQVGGSKISSLEDPSTEAELCSVYFEPSVRRALEARAWLFATGSEPVTLENPTEIGDAHYPYRFALPGDVVAVQECADSSGEEIGWQKRGQSLVSDSDDVRAIVTRYVEDPKEWTPTFAWAVAYLLAAVIAGPISENVGLADRMLKLYEYTIEQASPLDAIQTNEVKQLSLDSSSSAVARRRGR